MSDTRESFINGVEAIRRIIGSAQHVSSPKGYEKIIAIGKKAFIAVGILFAFVVIAWLFDKISGKILFHSFEVALVVCALIYCVIASCVVILRRRITKLYRQYPSAVFSVWNMDRYKETLTFDKFPSFSEFHSLPSDLAMDKWLVPLSVSKSNLAELEREIECINGIVKDACLSNREDVIRYLISTCQIRANQQSTCRQRTSFKYRDIPQFEVLSIKEILQNSFNSDFARDCILDILDGNFNRYALTAEGQKYVLVDENVVFTFFDKESVLPSSKGLGLYAVPAVILACTCSYGTGRIRYEHVSNVVKQNIENVKIANGVLAKLDIIEKYVSDSIAFVQATTVPLEYSISGTGLDYAPYVGGIFCFGEIEYSGTTFKNSGKFFYTYGTEMKIFSRAVEEDSVPSRASKAETICLSREDLVNPRQIRHDLRIVENRGRYHGYAAWERITYSFSVNGPKFPADKKIINAQLAAYDDSCEDVDIKGRIKELYLKKLPHKSSERLLQNKLPKYECIDLYNIDIKKEIFKMGQLVEHR